MALQEKQERSQMSMTQFNPKRIYVDDSPPLTWRTYLFFLSVDHVLELRHGRSSRKMRRTILWNCLQQRVINRADGNAMHRWSSIFPGIFQHYRRVCTNMRTNCMKCVYVTRIGTADLLWKVNVLPTSEMEQSLWQNMVTIDKSHHSY